MIDIETKKIVIKIIEEARAETEKEHGRPNVYIDMVSEIAIEKIIQLANK